MPTHKPNSLAVKAPWLEVEWHPDNDKKFWEVTFASAVKYSWICPKGHVYPAAPYNKSRAKNPMGCPDCSRRRVSDINSLATRAPHLEKEWHPSNKKKFHEVSYRSGKKFQWVCATGHVWPASPSNRTAKSPSGCPECPRRPLSVLAPHLRVEWGPTNPKAFDQTSCGESTKYEWVCAKGHVWSSAPCSRTHPKRPTGCPECVDNPLPLRAPHLVAEWGPNNRKKVDEVSACAQENYEWICSKGHSWWARPANRTSKKATGCPECSKLHSRAELTIFEAVKVKYPDAVSGQRRLLRSKGLELDIYVPSLKKAIEYDGTYWHTLPISIKNDARKNQQCVEAGIQLLRIPEAEYKADPSGTIAKALEWLRAES